MVGGIPAVYNLARMSREIVINSTKHESRIAVLDDGQVVELWIERSRHRTIVGNIYKGRVTKVLPGMQSAFVDLGLERDAFLYVSDVLEEFEEYETESAGDITLDEVPAARPETSIADLLRRTIRDVLWPEFKSVWIDSVEQYQRIVEFLDQIQPALVPRVRLYRRDEPIFDEFGIEPEIAKALNSKVWLKSGGYIVINQTEALVAIDVNTGKYVAKKNLEETVFRTNLEAARDIVRQIRPRSP